MYYKKVEKINNGKMITTEDVGVTGLDYEIEGAFGFFYSERMFDYILITFNEDYSGKRANRDEILVSREARYCEWDVYVEKFLQVRYKKLCDYIDDIFPAIYDTGKMFNEWYDRIYKRLLLAKKYLKRKGRITIRFDTDANEWRDNILNRIFGKKNFIGKQIIPKYGVEAGDINSKNCLWEYIYMR